MSSNNSQNPNQSQQQQQQQPGLMASHAEYMKGAAESTIGTMMGSHAWTTSGEQDKAHAKASMKAATENRDPAASGYGKAEEVAGKLTGCEGMRQEGAASAAQRKGD